MAKNSESSAETVKPFEGKILYDNSYKSKNMMMPSALWNSMMGPKGEYYIQGGNYKLISNGSLNKWQIYLNKDNKIYSKLSSSSAILFNDGEMQGDEVFKVEVNKNVTEVLGYPCDEVVMTCKSGVQKFYFNSAIAVDAKLFEKHKFVNWYDFVKVANALPLKRIVNTSYFTMECVATEVTPMKLESSIFELPAGVEIKKNTY